MPADNTFRLRRGTTEAWLGSTSPLRSGEPGYDLSTNILKIGNGNDLWTNLKSVIDITGTGYISGNLYINNTPVSISGHSHLASEMPNLGNISNSGTLIGFSSGVPLITTNNGSITGGSFGSLSNTFCAGNDVRFSDIFYTTGIQTASARKTFNSGIRVATSSIFALNLNSQPSSQFLISFGSFVAPLWTIAVRPSSIDNQPASTGVTTIVSQTSGNNTLYLPFGGVGRDGTLALLSDINMSQLTGVLDVNKGGTGQTSYSNGQLLIGSGTSLAVNTLTAGTGIFINNEAGKITINSTSSIDRDAVENIIASGNKNTTGFLRNGSGLAWTYTDNGANPGTLSVGITGIDLSLIPGLSGYFNDNLNTSIVQSTGIGLTYNSLTSQLFISVTGISTSLVTNFNSSVNSLISNHVHGNMTNSGTIGSVAGRPIITTSNGVLTTGVFGTTSGTFCQGNDSRLTGTELMLDVHYCMNDPISPYQDNILIYDIPDSDPYSAYDTSTGSFTVPSGKGGTYAIQITFVAGGTMTSTERVAGLKIQGNTIGQKSINLAVYAPTDDNYRTNSLGIVYLPEDEEVNVLVYPTDEVSPNNVVSFFNSVQFYRL